jgi:hypothetical protein
VLSSTNEVMYRRVEECSAAFFHIEQVQCLVCLMGLRLTLKSLKMKAACAFEK